MRRTLCLALAASLAVAMTPGFAAQPGGAAPAPATLAEARKAFGDGQYRRAEQALKQIIGRADPRLAPDAALVLSLELLGQVYREAGQYGAALKTGLRFRQALDRVPPAGAIDREASRREVAVLLAECYASLEHYDEAAKEFARALSFAGGVLKQDPVWEARQRTRLAQVLLAQRPNEAARAEAALAQATVLGERLVDQIERGKLDEKFRVAAVEALVECYLAGKRPAKAVAVLGRLLETQPAASLERAKSLSALARAYRESAELASEAPPLLAFLAEEQKQLVQAIALREQLEKDKPSADYADLLGRLGMVHDDLRKPDAARAAWRQGTQVLERLVAAPPANDRERAEQMQHRQRLQLLYQRLGEWTDCVRVTEQLLAFREETLLPGDPAIYRAKTALGGFLVKERRSAGAKDAAQYQRARILLRDAQQFWLNHKPLARLELATALNNLAEVDRALGDFPMALATFREALDYLEPVVDKDDLLLAEAYSNLASVGSAMGKYIVALKDYQKAYDVCTAARNVPRPRTDEVLSTLLLNMAALHKSQRQFGPAADYCKQALQIREKSVPRNDPALVPHYLASATLYLASDQSGVSGADDNLEKARSDAQWARSICQDRSLADSDEAASLNLVLGMISFRENAAGKVGPGGLDEARTLWQQALDLSRKRHLGVVEAKSLTYLTMLEAEAGRLPQADEFSQQAVKLQEQMQAYPNLFFMAMLNRARVLKKLGQADKAIEMLDNALDLVEAPRTAVIGGETERAEYFAQFSAGYDLLVDWYVEQSNPDLAPASADPKQARQAAFEHQQQYLEMALTKAEAGRNRTFLDQVRAARAEQERISAESNPQLAERSKKILEQYGQLRAAAAAAVAADDDDRLGEVKQALLAARKEYADIEKQVSSEVSFYRTAHDSDGSPQQWQFAAQRLVKPDNLILFYYLGQLRSHLFVVGEGVGIKHYPLVLSADAAASLRLAPGPLTRSAATKLVGLFLSDMQEKGLTSRGLKKGTVKGFKANMTPRRAVALADALLPLDVQSFIRKRDPKYLIIVPDGVLHQLPFEALPLNDASPPAYAMDELPAIAYAPSAMILSALVGRAAASQGEPPSVLTVGNPAYPDAPRLAQRGRRSLTTDDYLAFGGDLAPLLHTDQECRQVEANLKAWATGSVVRFSQQQATERNVRERIAGRRIVHLAAHGLVDQNFDNLFGAIALSPPPPGPVADDNDGFLSLYEISGLPLSGCELAVLSACQTYVGPDRPLEAGSTMARAFLAAGARRVLATHWDVNDEATADLVGEFAKALAAQLETGQDVNYATALHQARKKLRQAGFNDPYLWAPLVLIGPAE